MSSHIFTNYFLSICLSFWHFTKHKHKHTVWINNQRLQVELSSNISMNINFDSIKYNFKSKIIFVPIWKKFYFQFFKGIFQHFRQNCSQILGRNFIFEFWFLCWTVMKEKLFIINFIIICKLYSYGRFVQYINYNLNTLFNSYNHRFE
jgi:hypothetical protein